MGLCSNRWILRRGIILKRFFDITLSLALLIIVSPFILIIFIVLKIKNDIAIFQQKRPGLHAKIFTLYKFQTMTDEKDSQGQLLPDEARLTKFGLFLRKTSLDELPQLWNVLMGDMSFDPSPKTRPAFLEKSDCFDDLIDRVDGT